MTPGTTAARRAAAYEDIPANGFDGDGGGGGGGGTFGDDDGGEMGGGGGGFGERGGKRRSEALRPMPVSLSTYDVGSQSGTAARRVFLCLSLLLLAAAGILAGVVRVGGPAGAGGGAGARPGGAIEVAPGGGPDLTIEGAARPPPAAGGGGAAAAAAGTGQTAAAAGEGGGRGGGNPAPRPAPRASHSRDPAAAFRPRDPFHLTDAAWYGSVFAPPPFPAFGRGAGEGGRGGYLQHPSLHNGTLAFCSEGDLYLTRIPAGGDLPAAMAAVRVTSTVGNVLTPRINPTQPHLVAYTATYTGTREAYLLDLRSGAPAGPASRLTYFDGEYGVSQIVGWEDGGTGLIVAASHDEIGMEDTRLYRIGLVQGGGPGEGKGSSKGGRGTDGRLGGLPLAVSSVEPIPLHQAIDGVMDRGTGGAGAKAGPCLYFTRFKQSSSTFRYVGGTAEHLWAWCEGRDRAVPLTGDYRGTSRSPRIYRGARDGPSFLMFLSDRHDAGGGSEWIPGSLNLWALPLPSSEALYASADSSPDLSGETDGMPEMDRPFQLTSVSCDHNGMSLMEYDVDEATGDVVLRIGADLHLMESPGVAKLLRSGGVNGNVGDRQLKKEDTKGDAKKKKKSNHNNATQADRVENDVEKEQKRSPSSTDQAISRTPTSVLPISILSDLQNLHERLLPVSHAGYVRFLNHIDAFETPYGTMSALLTIRGQLWVNPVIPDLESMYTYEGGGMNMPARRYRVAPGSMTGGMTRILVAKMVPQPEKYTRTSIVLATDPLSPTAELAFYLVEALADGTPAFAEVDDLPKPYIGGHISGGSVQVGGLGSINRDSVTVSPCGRRVAWTDTDGRICAMSLPRLGDYWSVNATDVSGQYTVLPQENENGQPMVGVGAELTWSPGGRYLAIGHTARNQMEIISIADLGALSVSNQGGEVNATSDESLEDWNIDVARIVQATPDRFNSGDVYWGRSALDIKLDNTLHAVPTARTLFYLSDRDVVLTDVKSPWGTRAPSPHFDKGKSLFALPLALENGEDSDDESLDKERARIKEVLGAPFAGGGASELMMLREGVQEVLDALKDKKGEGGDAEENTSAPTTLPTSLPNASAENVTMADNDSSQSESDVAPDFSVDVEINFGPKSDVSLSFARRAYRMSNVKKADYLGIVSQLNDDASLILLENGEDGSPALKVFSIDDFPSDATEPLPIKLKIPLKVVSASLSTSRQHLCLIYKMTGKTRTKIISNTAGSVVNLVKDDEFSTNIVDNVQWALSIFPSLEYQQMYSDAWRLLRDYFYDAGMTNIDWKEIHDRYLPLVDRCAKREELDDVLRQMASELSALHVFVYGGEYSSPLDGDELAEVANEVASLGATLRRSVDWAGYVVTAVPERDPDFGLTDDKPVYSPLSERVLRMTGQRGLEVGDVIIGVNGESVMSVPGMHMLLRGMAGMSVRLEVLRVKSGPSRFLTAGWESRRTLNAIANGDDSVPPEPLIVVPLSPPEAANLRYGAWEWQTRERVKELSTKAGFTAGYMHLRSMSGASAEDAFVRGFYPDYDKQALIVDVRHNHGGNIDSWLLDVLQRRDWMYWQGRATNVTNGGLGWDEQFAFRGHIVVLVDEKTSSDGEGFSRGVSELGLGKLVGTRTWGGGIWLSSDNHLVDGGIATAPEIGTYNKKFGWGLGIENTGVEPDVWVDNDPYQTYNGRDAQLEKAIEVLKDWLEEEAVVLPQSPGTHRDMSLKDEAKACPSK